MFPSLTGSLTGTKLESLYGDVSQDGPFILQSNAMSQLKSPSLTGSLTDTKLESSYWDVGQEGLFIL